ncbi:hypothetical protein BLA6993_07031 [Burkholderia lata]|uniref:hypothetical protein n=1 Tax=Burkholderia lata (strain ATCC 17760 / DSM 23089 / LMG 22485 / NCIMB 9086 / R18194 / 383) TaxID=482957 RepID=UPI001452E411|nr:hypothetical protein [Burkholderia lata]VWC40646.1 hypothetical protein BLA6993_07031 [Burkholderia lata]
MKPNDQLRAALATVPRGYSATWAFRLLMRGINVPPEVARVAADAIYSSAGRQAIAHCGDAQMRVDYQAIYDAIAQQRAGVGGGT